MFGIDLTMIRENDFKNTGDIYCCRHQKQVMKSAKINICI